MVSTANNAHLSFFYQNTFNQNYAGAFLSGTPNTLGFFDNTFNVGTMGMNTTPLLVPFGAYINHCNNIKVTYNEFSDGVAGLYVNNSIYAHQIYHNSFSNLTNNLWNASAFIALQDNKALKLSCNTFTNNSYDIALIDATINQKQGNYDLNTGSFIGGARNVFYDHNISIASTGDNAITVQNTNYFTGFYIDYAHYDFGDIDNPKNWTTVGKVNLFTVSGTFDYNTMCPAHSYHSMHIDINDYGTRMAQQQQTIEAKKDTLVQLVDGGDTPGLLNEVEGLTPRNYFRVAADLYQATPYLSDTVLLSFMRNPIHRPLAKTVVLWANSPLPVRGKAEIDNTNLPPVFKYLLWQYQNGTNPRELKEQEIDYLRYQKDSIKSQMLYDVAVFDTLPGVTDSVITVLRNDPDYNSQMDVINILLKQNRFNETAQELNNLYYNTLNLPANEQQAVADYIDIRNLLLTMAQMPDSLHDSLIIANAAWLGDIADDDNRRFAGDAHDLLWQAGLRPLIEETPLPDPMFNKRLEMTAETNQPDFSNMDWSQLINIYPNPAGNELSVEYALIEKGQYRLAIFDLKGKQLLSKPLTGPFGLVKIKTDNLPQGNYIISVTNNNQPSKISKQFTVVH